MKPINHQQRFAGLDGLRGLAILMVFAFHYYPRAPHDPFSLLASAGWLGVDLFFVLSGFLITGILFDTVHQPRFFTNFYARRSLRLFPVYFFMAGVVLLFAFATGGTFDIWQLPFFVYGSNIVGDLGHAPHLGPYIEVGHLWSLALEEQFYLFWAPAIFFLVTSRRIVIACIVGALGSFALRWFLLDHPVLPGYTSYTELPTRLDGLLLGGALSIALRSPRASRWLQSSWLYAVALTGFAAILVCMWSGNSAHWSGTPMTRFGYTAAACMFGAVILLTIVPGTWINRIGEIPLLRAFGRYSYGFYLWHQIPAEPYKHAVAWVVARIQVPVLGPLVAMALLFAFNMGIAFLSYHGIELFFLRLKRFFAYEDERKAHHVAADTEVSLST